MVNSLINHRIINTLNKLKERNRVFGTMVSNFSWTGIIPILEKKKLDFAVFEMEHSYFDWGDLEALLRSANSVGLTSIVRIPDITYEQISKPLDLGANGILIPRIENLNQLKEVISMIRIPPKGKKGIGGYDFAVKDLSEKLKNYNQEKQLFIQIENPQAILELDSMLATGEVAGVVVGPYDLSVSLGIPGQFENSLFLDKVMQVISICNVHSVSCGMYLEEEEDIQKWINRGMNIIWYGSDLGLFIAGVDRLVEVINRIK